MHLIKDENDNLCSYIHNHEHAHDHHEVELCDDNSKTHEHDRKYTHNNISSENSDQMTAILDYMLKHNEHHAVELDQIAAKLQAAGKVIVAEQIKKAVHEFQKGNSYLSLALSLVKEG